MTTSSQRRERASSESDCFPRVKSGLMRSFSEDHCQMGAQYVRFNLDWTPWLSLGLTVAFVLRK